MLHGSSLPSNIGLATFDGQSTPGNLKDLVVARQIIFCATEGGEVACLGTQPTHPVDQNLTRERRQR